MKVLTNLVEINIAAMGQYVNDESESEEVPYVNTDDDNNMEYCYSKDCII